MEVGKLELPRSDYMYDMKAEGLKFLHAGEAWCGSDDAMRVMCEVLANMQSWRVDRMELGNMTPAGWSLLAEEVLRGSLGEVRVSKDDIREGAGSDVRAVRGSTERWCDRDGALHRNRCTIS